MPNPIKYTIGSETDALKKGNFYIGTGSVGKGPSESTGYYQGPSPVSGGYVIYLNRPGAPGSLSYNSVLNDAELISFTNNLAGTSFVSAAQCLVYYSNQTDRICVNIDYPPIITNGLVLNVDAGFSPSYPTSGVTWSDISGGNNNGTLINGPTFSSSNGGTIVFDGVDDYVNLSNFTININLPFTISFWSFLTTPVSLYPEVITFRTNSTNPFEIAFSDEVSYRGITYGSPITVRRKNDILLSNYINKWTQVVLSYQGGDSSNSSNFTLYDMGVISPTTTAGGYGNITNNSTLCGGTGAGIHWFKGNLSQTLVYNRALTAQEVLQNYNATKSRYGL